MALTYGHKRHSRLGLPRVNENPRPPGQNSMRRKVARSSVAFKGQRGQRAPQVQRHKVPSAPTAPNNGFQQQLQQALDPQSGLMVPNYGAAGQPDPRDASYYQNVYRLLATAQQNIGQNQLQQSYANTDYAENQQNLVLNQQRDQRGLAEKALRSGLINSGYLDRSDAELTQNYVTKQGDLNTQKYRDDAARQAARAAILQGFPQDVAAEYAQAAARYADLQLKQAQSGQGALTPKDVSHLSKALRKQITRRSGKRSGGHHR